MLIERLILAAGGNADTCGPQTDHDQLGVEYVIVAAIGNLNAERPKGTLTQHLQQLGGRHGTYPRNEEGGRQATRVRPAAAAELLRPQSMSWPHCSTPCADKDETAM